MKYLLLILFSTLCNNIPVTAQVIVKQVGGLPAKEIYDLHVDRKGCLWIAHGLGISRFDGLNFIHFFNTVQAALAARQYCYIIHLEAICIVIINN